MPRKQSFASQVAQNDAAAVKKEGNVVKDYLDPKQRIERPSKRICVLVDADKWDDFKKIAKQRYGITASAELNLLINQFLISEKAEAEV